MYKIIKNTGDEERQFVEHGEGENLLFEDQESNIEAEQSTAENLHTYLEPEDPKNPVLTPQFFDATVFSYRGASIRYAGVSGFVRFVAQRPFHRSR